MEVGSLEHVDAEAALMEATHDSLDILHVDPRAIFRRAHGDVINVHDATRDIC